MAEILGPGALVAVPAYWAPRRILGPTFDQIGIDLRDKYSDRRIENAQRMLEAMNRKAALNGSVTGSIPPRVASKILEDGSWCDAEVMSEYFGGILASSSSEDEMDDRGAAWASLVSRLSTRDVHLHYLCYQALRERFIGSTNVQLGIGQDRLNAQIYIPTLGILDAMDLEHSSVTFNRNVSESLISLQREDLVGDKYTVGTRELIKNEHNVNVPEEGLVFIPTVSGLQLFYWAHGFGHADINIILDPETSFDFEPAILLVAGSRSIRELGSDASI